VGCRLKIVSSHVKKSIVHHNINTLADKRWPFRATWYLEVGHGGYNVLRLSLDFCGRFATGNGLLWVYTVAVGPRFGC
jgi:hypothetical protein